MTTHSRPFETADEVEVEVHFELSGGSEAIVSGPPELCEPGEAAEVEIVAVWPVNGTIEVKLSEADRDRFRDEVLDNLGDYEDGPDPDDWRDNYDDHPVRYYD